MDAITNPTLPQPWSMTGLVGHPALALGLFALAQCLVWTLAPALSHNALPLDVVESALWGHEWIVGSFKHPNLPGWFLEAGRLLTGAISWPPYLISQLFVAATFLAVYGLGREMMDERRALAGVLLLAGVYYYAWPTIEFNHNVAQMPFWATIAWMMWRLRSCPSLVLWLGIGLISAVSLYAKLSAALLLTVAGLWIASDGEMRRQLRQPGPWLGLLAFFAACVPLLVWLDRTQYAALLYASERSADTDVGPIKFAASQVLACLGLLALAALAGLFGPTRPTGMASPEVPAPAIRFLVAMTLGPAVLVAVVAALAGVGLKGMWGSPMFGLAGLLTVALASARVTDAAILRLAYAASALLLLVPAGYVLETLYEASYTGEPKRQNWPEAEIESRFDALWQTEVGKPLGVVAGDRWIAGLVALRPGPMPSILTDGHTHQSPWITSARLHKDGILVVWEVKTPPQPLPPGLARLVEGHKSGSLSFAWPRFHDAKPLLIGYAIVPPG